ncbi:pentapeptide repeat-containing protein [Shewanella baltica]|uniref:pentapeptide repeat-containing protein n=1 Tax=Shewanella baltica TaxID=62322 RepID=UPI003D7A6B3F
MIKYKSINGIGAANLWLKGALEWNKFITKNPNIEINFDGYDFKVHRMKTISFNGYIFPNSRVSFANTDFGDANVSFREIHFECNEISFLNAKFLGEVDFSRSIFNTDILTFQGATFDKKNIKFIECTFTGNIVNFYRCNFGFGMLSFKNSCFKQHTLKFSNCIKAAGSIEFQDVKFCVEYIDFSSSNFSIPDEANKSSLNFTDSTFDVLEILFNHAKLERRNAIFKRVKLKKGDLVLSNCNFSNSDINLSNIRISDGDLNLSNSDLNNSRLIAKRSTFSGNVNLSKIKNCHKITEFDLSFSSFGGSIDLTNNEFNIVPDLCYTKLTNQLPLDSFKFGIKYHNLKAIKLIPYKKISNPDDIRKIRRLKELAEQNKDFEAALQLHANELMSKRWTEFNFLKSILDMLYSIVSNYGRSIIRPTIALLLSSATLSLFFFTSAILSNIANSYEDYNFLKGYGCSIELVLASSLPFLSPSRDLRTHAIEQLFGGNLPQYYGLSIIIYALFSSICIFLIGLALRNRFRL